VRGASWSVARAGALGAALLGAALLAAAACRPGTGAAAAEASSPAAQAAPADSIVPRGPRGAAAARFPAPARPVSAIVAPRWTDEDTRDDAGEVARVVRLARVGPGARVADVGAGDGYYAVRLAPLVAPGGVVYAQDIEARYLGLLQRRLRERPQPGVVLALGEPHDPRLPPASADVVLMIHMYHEIEQPFGLLYNLYPAMRPGARVVILDTTRPTGQHGTPPDLLRCELRAMGYTELAFDPYAADEYLAVFSPPASAAALTAPEAVAGRLAALGCARYAR
jgi:SAM-dependent methyltransferase